MSGNGRRLPWYRQAARALLLHCYLKGTGTPIFIGLFFAAYLYLLKNPAYPATVMPVTVLDQLIGFQPWTLPLYVSLWVYVSLPPALLETRRELYGYALVMTALCMAGLAVFYVWPTAVPVADVDWALYPGMDFLKRMDAAGNACPSLHVATAVFSGAWLYHLLRRFGAPSWVQLVNWAWCAGIVYSTLATRQHVAVDVIAGLLLGALAAVFSLRHRMNADAADQVSSRTV